MTAYDPTNVFARILRGELPSQRVFEDARTLASSLARYRLILRRARTRPDRDDDTPF